MCATYPSARIWQESVGAGAGRALELSGVQLRQNERTILREQPGRALHDERFGTFDVHLDQPDRPRQRHLVESHDRHLPSLVAGERPRASRSRYAPPVFKVSTGNVSVAVPDRAPTAARWNIDAIAEPVLRDRSLEELRVGVERLEGVNPSRRVRPSPPCAW